MHIEYAFRLAFILVGHPRDLALYARSWIGWLDQAVSGDDCQSGNNGWIGSLQYVLMMESTLLILDTLFRTECFKDLLIDV